MAARSDSVPDIVDQVDECEVSRVLQYWFSSPQGTESSSGDYNFKYKWFPGAISLAQQRSVDAEVYTSFNNLFRDALEMKLQHWQQSASGSVALIVVLDQFSRHICRHVGSMEQEQRAADQLALQASKAFFGRNGLPEGRVPSSDVMSLPMPQFVFALMPLRHASAVPDLRYVLDKLKEKEECEEKHLLLLLKFRKQTTRQLQHLQDRALLEASDDILERHSFPSDESDIMQHPLVAALEQFLSRHLLLVSGPEGEETRRVPPAPTAIFSVVVSLSGGVDSMVISKILVLLKDKVPRLRIKQVLAVHIDYGNRPESVREAEYIETQWCADNGIQCRVRRIAEVTRGVTNRDQYEKVSREIRYGFYRACLQEEASHGLLVSGVIFGHHMGDVQENVLSNIMRGSSPLQLSGMTECSTANGVCVWRPLLRHTKDDIYSFAHRYGVPYFKDSTPSWSTRGKLRSSLLPLLLDMYGTGCLNNLSQLAEDSDRTRDLVQANLYDPFMSSIKRFPCGLRVDILPYRWQPQCFWREALKQLMHSMGMGMIRDKAVCNFVERIQRISSGTLQSGWLELRKGFHTLLKSDGELVVIRDGCLGKFSDSSVLVNTPNTVNHRRQQLQLRAKQFHADPAVLPGLLSSLDSAFARLEADIHELLIFRVLIDDAFCSLDFDASLLNELIVRDFSDANSGQSSSTVVGSVAMGSWSLNIRPLPACPDTPPTVALSVEDILPGRLSYRVLLPSVDTESPSMVLLHQVEKIRISFGEVAAFLNAIGSISPVDDHNAKFNALVDGTLYPSSETITVRSLLDSIAPFSGLESRIKFGIPILMPTVCSSSDSSSSTAVKVQYSYSNVLPLI